MLSKLRVVLIRRDDRRDAWCGKVWLTRVAGWLSFPTGSAGGLSDCACRETHYLIPSHLSLAEKGARIALAHLSMGTYLHMAMRLVKEARRGAGAMIVEAACAMFTIWGVSGQ